MILMILMILMKKVSMKEIRLMKIKCINLYLKSKRISKKFVFQAQTCPT